MSVDFVELSATGGAQVRGVDISRKLDQALAAELDQALVEYGFLVIRGQALTARQLADLGQSFGRIQPHVQRAYQHPEVPEVVLMTNRKADGTFDEAGARRGAIENTRDGWHSDLSYDPVPAKATLLHSLEVPSSGGNTCFSNAHLAYSALSEEIRAELDGTRAEFVYGGHSRNSSTATAASVLDEAGRASAHAVHPVIAEHPVSGRPAIYANPLITTGIVGWSTQRSERMLEHLFDALDDGRYCVEHQWQVHDTLIWDNRGGLMHTGRLDYPRDEARRMIRTTVSGAPIRAFSRES